MSYTQRAERLWNSQTARESRDDVSPHPVTFLVGAERSGTTLTRLMLDGHPELAFRYEFELAVDLVPPGEGWPELETYYEYLRTYRFVDPPPHIDRELDYPSLVRSFLEQKRRADRKPRVGAVVHRNFDRLLRIWPDARFVHLMRDPRDVARSCVGMGWAGHVWSGVAPWIEAELLWERMSASLPRHRWITVRYEDLVRDPQRELERVCRLAGIPFHPAMLDFPSRSTYRAPSPSFVEQWRTKLTPREVQLVESRVHDMLAPRGYAPSGLERIEPSALERAALRAQCRAGRARHAARSLGVRLWIERAVAHRGGPRGWRERVQRRVDAAINAQLA
ncbi:sulfotransferase family protein [Sandaracinus amylolyticus]|uniref:sulfotransferase family protein n=1 Tax=Sandaracinus amylolyticus TaxID=927083 RepID=UPI001F417FF5|nr:sulfotransferase [Sandaracinus amylolyticus]UJR85623.1 Hypothetical protein I5071_77030 [Sandaracinus amylolyticus]